MLKRFFSLFLVTVLAISVLGFSAPTEAKETDFFTPTTSTELTNLPYWKLIL
ncbi:hypothetical protein P8807_18815 [Bacillus subtilis]|uniref:hypothetical protein n=1 Tax=Bacillus subtilis TaxID=1423 RepID=UPI002DB837D7|nr:hypothetical protein [Bacillus subtilis]MEC0413578.1 hypothetical protein [Bacillus subtilis]MEC0423238.1 hypothetical protein [Bacillus subtilis]